MRKIGRFGRLAIAASLSMRAIAHGVQDRPAAPGALIDAQRQQALAIERRSADDYAGAISHAEQALALRERARGPASIEVARSLLLLGQLNDQVAQYDVAEPLFRRAEAIAERSGRADEL